MARTATAARWWQRLAIVGIAVTTAGSIACGRGLFGKVYEYEEDLYLSLDGSADLIVNASIPALVALRGLDLDVNPRALVDRATIRAAYESPVTDVTRVSRPWRRHGRRYVQIRLSVRDIRRLSEVPPLAWSTYALVPDNERVVFTQTIGPSALKPGTLANVGWDGRERVAFRLHLPSRIVWHNARDLDTNETSDVGRGNILGWEQQLADRLEGNPIAIEVRMDNQSILYRTLWLFAGAFGAAVLLIGSLIWIAMRKGARDAAASGAS